MGVLVQYQPSGNDLTPPAGANSNCDAITRAQLTHLISGDDAAQGQDAPNVQDAPMPDAPIVGKLWCSATLSGCTIGTLFGLRIGQHFGPWYAPE